jgi:3',5'-cyclic AMP phosphodiesterase CpdA
MTGAPLLQISDPHFGTEIPAVVRALERLAHEQSPCAVVLSGDITQRARRPEFDAARAFVQRLGVRDVVAIPGNHDIPLFQVGARLFSPYARYVRAFGPALEPVFESPDWLVIGVNTTRWYRHEDGEVSPGQIERVAARLERATPAQARLVVTHQPVAVTRPQDEANRLHGRDAAVARWSDAGADLVLGGHIHLPFVRPLQAMVADCPRAVWAVQAGTAVSTRTRAGQPNSVNLIRRCPGVGSDAATGAGAGAGGADRAAPRGRVLIERWDYAAELDRFTCAQTHDLALDAVTVALGDHGSRGGKGIDGLGDAGAAAPSSRP